MTANTIAEILTTSEVHKNRIFSGFFEISQFPLEMYPLERKSRIEFDGESFWFCQIKIENVYLVFKKSFWNVANQTSMFRLLKL